CKMVGIWQPAASSHLWLPRRLWSVELLTHRPTEDKQIVRKPVEKLNNQGVDWLHVVQRHGQPFSTPADGTRHVPERNRRMTAGKYECLHRLEPRLHLIDCFLQVGDVRVGQ